MGYRIELFSDVTMADDVDGPPIDVGVGLLELIYPDVRPFKGHPELWKPKWIVYYCPCGCGHLTKIDLQKSHDPHWEIVLEERGENCFLTLSPSVINHVCGSHYFIRDNRVDWC